jgi:hypothetical protein
MFLSVVHAGDEIHHARCTNTCRHHSSVNRFSPLMPLKDQPRTHLPSGCKQVETNSFTSLQNHRNTFKWSWNGIGKTFQSFRLPANELFFTESNTWRIHFYKPGKISLAVSFTDCPHGKLSHCHLLIYKCCAIVLVKLVDAVTVP